MSGKKKNPRPLRHPAWERIEYEGRTPHMYFLQYLRQDRPRNIKRLSETMGISYDVLRHYSSHHEWTARANAWDDYIEGIGVSEVISNACNSVRSIGMTRVSVKIESLVVGGCVECPLRNHTMSLCRHPRVDFKLRCLESVDVSPPIGCPLRSHSFLLALEVEE